MRTNNKAFTLIQLPAVRKRAFTLIELLVVIAILGILLSILTPSLYAVKQAGYATKTRAIVMSLSGGILQFKLDTGYYPGQKDTTVLSSNKGSCYLSNQLIDFSEYITDRANKLPKSKYCDYTKDFLLTTYSNLEDNAISDGFPNGPLPILYYPSRIGSDGSVDQSFAYADNSSYTTDYNQTDFQKFISKTDAFLNGNQIQDTDWPKNSSASYDATKYAAQKSDEFILIGAGADRKFFTHDDVKNW